MSNATNGATGKTRNAARSRFDPKAVTGMRLEARDEELLCDLFRHRLMSRGQLETLYFTSSVRAHARLRLLFDHRFVNRFFPPISPYGAQALYSVGPAALPVVAQKLGMELAQVRRLYKRNKTPTFIEHTLAINDFRLALLKSLKEQSEWRLEAWLSEMECRHEWTIRVSGGAERKEVFKPDAFFRLARQNDGQVRDFFLEIDMGHTSARQFEGKLNTHTRYLESGLFEEIYGNGYFRTLVVTTGEKRLQNLQALARANESDLFRFATLEQTGRGIIFERIWIGAGAESP